jgi:hypothetical protein
MPTQPDHGETNSGETEPVVSPTWHGEILAERERLISTGQETYIDWEKAKQQLRAELR